MLQLPIGAIIEKNKLASDKPWFILLEIWHKDFAEPWYLARNNEDITWNEKTWIAFPVEIDDVEQDMKALPSLSIKISNVDGIVQSSLERYDGLVDATVTLRVVHQSMLHNPIPHLEETFNVNDVNYDESWATFTIGADFWFYNRFQVFRYLKDSCQYKYKGVRCGSESSLATCSRTILGCKERFPEGTPLRFSGEPGLGGGLYQSNS